MKKLFTLVALLACFIGANAVEIEDFSLDYTKVGKAAVGWKGEVITDDLVTADDEGLKFTNNEALAEWWGYQVWISSGANLTVDDEYTVKIVAKVSEGTANVRCKIGDWGAGFSGAIAVTGSEFQEYTFTGKAGTASNGLLVQFGDYVGTVTFKSLTIVHEGQADKPVNWINTLTNGNAEGEYGSVACFYSHEFDADMRDVDKQVAHTGLIEADPADPSNKVFVCHANAVEPPLTYEVDTELWGSVRPAGSAMPHNTYANQMFIVFPHALKSGESYKISFKYKASKAHTVSTQEHKMPKEYVGGGSVGTLNFTTEWQTYTSKELAAGGAGVQSIAFNLGDEQEGGVVGYSENLDFYIDDIVFEEMELEKGFFVAVADAEGKYDCAAAVKFQEEDVEGTPVLAATVGTEGNQESWATQVMISTVYGNTNQFKANTITAKLANEQMASYTESSNGKINLPARGVWKLYIFNEDNMIYCEQIEGDAIKEPIEITPNPAVLTVNAVERKMTMDEAVAAELVADKEAATDEQKAEYSGQPWDNQFAIIANRPLQAGEVTVIEFDYVATKEASTGTQCTGATCGSYIHWGAIGDVNFTTEEQHYSKTYTIPAEVDGKGMQSITFNMAVFKDANEYTIKNVVWKLEDDTESLIDMEGTKNFAVKTGAGTDPKQYGEETGVAEVNAEAAVAPVKVLTAKGIQIGNYNIAGQRVK